ncbi:SbcC/MukB-like Walker B domain-containing protein [Kribbella sp. NPDC056861]|uniref:SbcC/MukB-like Walker B domain-containing protein n=1 Tax=Kribbella sp. NPDC056861 TaxID=3154857 RepID=UPI003430378C
MRQRLLRLVTATVATGAVVSASSRSIAALNSADGHAALMAGDLGRVIRLARKALKRDQADLARLLNIGQMSATWTIRGSRSRVHGRPPGGQRVRPPGSIWRATVVQKTNLAREIGELGSRLETATADHATAVAHRDDAAGRFRRLTVGTFPMDSDLPNVAEFNDGLAGSDGVRTALDAARRVAAAWPSLPHAPNHLADAVRLLAQSVHECRETLRSRADLDVETDEEVQVLAAIVDGLRVGAAELLRILRHDADQSRLEITDQERELFDRTLTGDTRRHLASRIRQANEMVDKMNLRLAQVKTASKVAVQLVWQVAPELAAGTRSARQLLLKNPADLSDADRESLHRFLRDRVELARTDDTATTWAEQLAQVFDYTAWHHFVVKVDRGRGDGLQPLTRKLHGALSGGEKAIALHLPLFAVVAAHYESVLDAPRVILLDEVFVGVDSANRGQVFALLAALDLDLMLTSDHEWCTYAELPGIGIHQLVTAVDGDDAVTTARFTWDGHDLSADEVQVPT